ncbi:Ribosome-releasing factor 2, mitochondrial [Nakaseomyces bracarensis]|uniref:Ribosome-releasing factor 2, mitochondrial n=1 Tax=Nakaseomyces bracarensis TaxID=273131 RepID=A0ABR4NUT7_9SACH
MYKTRLFGCVRRFSLSARLQSSIDKLRNIGIIAHIDAGKTTTTERMLFCAGKTKAIGDVDTGDTVTDFLPQERERGITIQSAAISFQWHDPARDKETQTINLIDTPGHADFIFEVIRSLRVLDGAVLILDGVAGVEAQSEKLWRHSQGIPKICYINKMDRVGAGYSRTLKELTYKMKTRTVLINFPYFVENVHEDSQFIGVVDVINMKLLKWRNRDNDPLDVQVVDLYSIPDDQSYKEAKMVREAMVETLGELDEHFIEQFLEGTAEGDAMKVSSHILNSSIRRLTINNEITPVLSGSSFRNIGIQPLLDSIIQYLPSPIEAKLPDLNDKNIPIRFDPKTGALINGQNQLCVALAFKVITDSIRGLMVFVRVYSGTLSSGYTVYNTTTGEKFRLGKLVIMQADQPQDVKLLSAGQIGVLTGTSIANKVKTGDTIISHSMKKDGVRSFGEKELQLKINPINTPAPVFSVIVEPRSLGNKKAIEDALDRLTIEDPSLHVVRDEESGLTYLNGMGELHLEIAKYKLLNEFRAPVEFGKIMVSYKETLEHELKTSHYNNENGTKFSIRVEPIDAVNIKSIEDAGSSCFPIGNDENYLIIDGLQERLTKSEWMHQIPIKVFINTLLSSAMAAFQSGGMHAHLPLFSCAVRLHTDWAFPSDLDNPSEILEIIRNLIHDSLRNTTKESFSILEPVMDVRVAVPQNDMGSVIQDLNSARNAIITSVEDDVISSTDKNEEVIQIIDNMYFPEDTTLNLANINNNAMKIINAVCPLKEMVMYSKKLRSLTKGRGELNMEYSGMNKVTPDRIGEIISTM